MLDIMLAQQLRRWPGIGSMYRVCRSGQWSLVVNNPLSAKLFKVHVT